MGVLSITGQALVAIGLNRHISLKAKELSQNISVLRRAAQPGWQQKVMTLIRKSRYDTPQAELKRLKATKVLTEDVSTQLDASINTVHSTLNKKSFDQIKMLMGQALEVKSIYGDTHHVFLHAQASNWLGLTYLVKELHRMFEPNTPIGHFKFLRPPLKLCPPGILSSLWKSCRNALLEEEKITNVQEYIHSKWFVNDSDRETRENLLSVDGYFFNAQTYESSLFFLINNCNILGKPDTIKDFYGQIIKHYCPNLSEQELGQFSNRIFYVVQSTEAACGNLFTICVPKEKSQEIQYRAHPFGAVCACHPKENSSILLENLQKGLFDKRAECDIIYPPIPQYRIYTPLLQPDVTPTYLLTPHEKTHRKAIKAKIKEIVAALYYDKIRSLGLT